MKPKKHLSQFILLVELIMLSSISSLWSQEKQVLYAGLVNSKGYVVGAKLSASGLYQFEKDTTWLHTGLNHPRVSAIAYDPKNPEVILLACGNGALRTTDAGKSWRITTDWRVTETQDICVDPRDNKSFYLATAYGIWRTHDHGDSWIESNRGLSKKYTQAITVDRKQRGRVVAATEGGVFVSNDNAENWKQASAKAIALDVQQSASSPALWLAGTDSSGVLISRDNAESWSVIEGPMAGRSIYSVAIDPYDAKHMAAAGWNTWVFLSQDGGETWQESRQGLPVPHFYTLLFDINNKGHLWAATAEEGIYELGPSEEEWRFRGMYGALVFDLTFMPRRLK